MISQNARGDADVVQEWASRLQRWGIGGWAPLLIDILRPFGVLAAQAIHLFSPILSAFSSPADRDALAALLESPDALDRLSETLSPRDSS